MGSLARPKAWREPAGEAKPHVCVISDGEAGAYCTVGLVIYVNGQTSDQDHAHVNNETLVLELFIHRNI